MSVAIIAAAIPAAIVGGLLAVHEVRRFIRERREARERVLRRIAEVREAVGSGVHHGERFTLSPADLPHGKETHVSTSGERSENRD